MIFFKFFKKKFKKTSQNKLLKKKLINIIKYKHFPEFNKIIFLFYKFPILNLLII